MSESIYGKYEEVIHHIMDDFVKDIMSYHKQVYEETGYKLFEHLTNRIKSEESMREKCIRKGLPQTPKSALYDMKDAIGIRIIYSFIDDIYKSIKYIKEIPDCKVVKEKDYIKHAKENGYRSYHMILEMTVPYEDVNGNNPGKYYIEIQLRTIAMDSWASLEHQLKYKKNVSNQKLIVEELKRCADEMAACDVSMQTIRNLIQQS